MIDTSGMTMIPKLTASEREPDRDSAKLAVEAQAFLTSHKWCDAVLEGYLDRSWVGIAAVFYFRLRPAASSADDEVWVVTGDLPPAYVDCVQFLNGAQALDGYCGAMLDWVAAVREGRSVASLVPVVERHSLVVMEPTLELADNLERRVRFILNKILPECEHELTD